MKFLEYREYLINEILKFHPPKKILKKGTNLNDFDFYEEKILILNKGLIRYYHNLCEEKDFLLGCYKEQNLIIIDNLSSYLDDEKYLESFFIEICEDSEFYLINNELLMNIFNNDIILYKKILEYKSIFYQKLFFQMRDIKLFTIENAILSLLIRAYHTYGDENIIAHKILNKNIARCLNSTEETISRILSKLKKEGIITIKNHHFYIENLNEIEKRLGCNFCKKNICYF